MTVNNIVAIGCQEMLNFADAPWINHWISIVYTSDEAFQTMDNHVCRRLRWVCWCNLLPSRGRDQMVGHNVNVVAQPSELQSETVDVGLDSTDARRIAIGQQAYSQFGHHNSILEVGGWRLEVRIRHPTSKPANG